MTFSTVSVSESNNNTTIIKINKATIDTNDIIIKSSNSNRRMRVCLSSNFQHRDLFSFRALNFELPAQLELEMSDAQTSWQDTTLKSTQEARDANKSQNLGMLSDSMKQMRYSKCNSYPGL